MREILMLEGSRVGFYNPKRMGVRSGNRGDTQDIVCSGRNTGLNDNHSIAYCLLGYLCAYYRYYHPIEFITAYLNNASNDTDIQHGTILAKQYGISVVPPKFGISRSDYAFDRDRNTIAKGLASIKYMGAKVTESLHRLSVECKYEFFVDLVDDLANKVLLDARQLMILIHIDFFSDFGNQRELERIVDTWNFFKRGAAVQVKKDVVAGSPMDDIIRRHSTSTRKDGSESASYKITDMKAILHECETAILGLGLSDYGVISKAKYFNEAMGYNGFVSGRTEDRPVLFVRDVLPVKRKRDGKKFGYNVLTQSLGSGIESRFTVFNTTYNLDPIHKGDVIRCIRYTRDGKGYFTLENYRHIVDDDDGGST